jgi:hypothetical protein
MSVSYPVLDIEYILIQIICHMQSQFLIILRFKIRPNIRTKFETLHFSYHLHGTVLGTVIASFLLFLFYMEQWSQDQHNHLPLVTTTKHFKHVKWNECIHINYTNSQKGKQKYWEANWIQCLVEFCCVKTCFSIHCSGTLYIFHQIIPIFTTKYYNKWYSKIPLHLLTMVKNNKILEHYTLCDQNYLDTYSKL